MKVECEISNYTETEGSTIDLPKIQVRSIFARGELAEIQIENTKFVVSIDEMQSALSKCKLDCWALRRIQMQKGDKE